MDTVIISPPKYYEVNGQVTPVICASGQHTVGANRTVVAAITGKRVRIMGLQGCAESIAGYGSIQFRDASGGTFISSLIYLYQADKPSPQFWPIVDSGYGIETAAGNGLYIDVAVNTVNLNVFYIAYTPS